ncbi:glucarate dehydratase, partial [Burkholderia multivorans]
IWQDGERLTREPLKIENGLVEVPKRPGLGVDIDMDAVARAKAVLLVQLVRTRDDAAAMQYLIPGWTFDNKR